MTAEMLATLVTRVQEIALDVASLRRMVDEQELAVSDRQYVSRCFDLLDMELGALRQYLDGMQ